MFEGSEDLDRMPCGASRKNNLHLTGSLVPYMFLQLKDLFPFTASGKYQGSAIKIC